MKLWLISQSVNNGYDTFDQAVVATETDTEARHINPNTVVHYTWEFFEGCFRWVGHYENGNRYAASGGDWADPSEVQVDYLGEAKEGTEPGVICSSFNAG